MKELLAVISLLVSGALAEPPAPYPASGWRPSGPSFDLPQRGQQQPPQKQQYLPPVDPRNPAFTPDFTAEGDVSVQGLPPPQEQQPLFQTSPISGQQYAGPSFNNDLRNLDQSYKQSQYEQQQERYREYQRQKQLEATQNAPNGNRLPIPQDPRQFARTTTTTTTTTEAPTTTIVSTTENDLNQGEVLNKDVKKAENLKNGKTSVEVTKLNVQEYPGEFFLGSLAQIQLQPQFVPLQPYSGAYVQPQDSSQKQVAGFDAATHFSAFPSVLAQQQQQNLQPQYQNPALLVQGDSPVLVQQSYQPYQPQVQTQLQPEPAVLQAPAQLQPNYYAQPNRDAVAIQQPGIQYQLSNSYQPELQPNPDAVAIQPQYQPQPQGFQIQAQPVIYQPQPQLVQPNQFAQSGQYPSQFPEPGKERENDDEDSQDEDREEQEDQKNQQQLYQQPIIVQPQAQYQPQQFPAQLIQNQDQSQFYQNPQPQTQYLQPQGQFIQPQGQFIQADPQFSQPQGQFAQPDGQFAQPQIQYQPQTQYQPQVQYQPQPQSQFQAQGQFIQPQSQFQQGQLIQPQSQFQQGQFIQLQDQFQNQGQLIQPQGQFIQPQGQYAQQQFQGQDSLQSGLDINQEGNDIDQIEDTDTDKPQGATAVATAFGTRTQPRVQPQYGVPFPVPKVQANPETNTEAAVEDTTDDGPAVAQATAVASGERRKSARLRNRRIRPVYAVDRSGRLVFAEAS